MQAPLRCLGVASHRFAAGLLRSSVELSQFAAIRASATRGVRTSVSGDSVGCSGRLLEGVLAERVGFEPTVLVKVHTLSKRAP